jgi:hypothetical protein
MDQLIPKRSPLRVKIQLRRHHLLVRRKGKRRGSPKNDRKARQAMITKPSTLKTSSNTTK